MGLGGEGEDHCGLRGPCLEEGFLHQPAKGSHQKIRFSSFSQALMAGGGVQTAPGRWPGSKSPL